MSRQAHNIRIGPAGWSYDDWKGVVYPVNMPKSLHGLTYLSRFFDTLEINTSFYHPPNDRNCESWIRKVESNPHFKFTLKLWQGFTHKRDTWPTNEETSAFLKGIDPFVKEDKLGAILIQFPWSFKRTIKNRQWLTRIIDTFSEYPMALEVRHSSWDHPDFYTSLNQYKVAFCNIDQPIFKDSLPPTEKVTSNIAYIRLHGRNKANWFRENASRNERYDYLYSQKELLVWIDRIERIRLEADEIYVITNNHYRGQAVVNAMELQEGMGLLELNVPRHLLDAYPRLERSLSR